MLESIRNEINTAYTENGARAFATTCSDCLDLFAVIGALRREPDERITTGFMRAYTENPDLAMKILFYARDVRGGLGERRVFRVILDWLSKNEKASLIKNIEYIAEYGRFDDLLALIGTPCEKEALGVISARLEADIAAAAAGKEVSLLAKWLPSVNASSEDTVRLAKVIARHLKMSDAQYRRTLVMLRARIRIIENNLREKDYTFDYSKQPSKAMYKYRAAFIRNDGDRYREFIARVNSGAVKLNARTLYPYELVQPYLSWNAYTSANKSFMKEITEEEKNVLNATWASLPDFTNGVNALAVVDTSGSIYCCGNPVPASVSLSLGVYFAERNKGIFRNHFIEFSENPRLIEIKGNTFSNRLRFISSFNEIANTNIEAVFEVILNAAVKKKAAPDELPSTLYIISDMEFDSCVNNASATVFQNAKARFTAAGYKLPKIVFWNVASRGNRLPVTKNELGVALVSGCTPRIFSMIASGELSAMEYMLDILGGERYAKISA